MTKPKAPKNTVVKIEDPLKSKGELKCLGGSNSDTLNKALAAQVVNTLWLKDADEEERERLMSASLSALAGIAPRDELEGMLAA